MQVHQGWSGEVDHNKWAKFDITLDEEDLRRLVGDDMRRTIDTTTAYRLLELEAERLVMAKLVSRYGYDPVAGREILTSLRKQIEAMKDDLAAGR